jgi:DNA-binding winged helix-turn-helix (wHTH) protein
MAGPNAGTGWWLEWSDDGVVRRTPISRQLTIGRRDTCDIVLRDPYVSREHCTVYADAAGTMVQAERALNPISVGGREVRSARLGHGGTFTVGETNFRVLGAAAGDNDKTLEYHQRQAAASLVLRSSARELIDRDGTLVAQFSAAEYLAFATLVRRYPDAANHTEIGAAVWGGMGFDQYQLHRLLQRIRQRLGDAADLLENVRGAGYRLRSPVDIL